MTNEITATEFLEECKDLDEHYNSCYVPTIIDGIKQKAKELQQKAKNGEIKGCGELRPLGFICGKLKDEYCEDCQEKINKGKEILEGILE